MPARWVTLAIVAFWLGTTGWLIYRETVAQTRAGEPPSFTIDLTDEVSANTISWAVLDNEEKVGLGRSWVRRRADRTFELRSEFRLHDLNVLKALQFRKLKTMYRVDSAGHFRGMEAEVYLHHEVEPAITITGNLENDFFHPQVKARIAGKDFYLPLADRVRVPPHGSILNPMHLVNRIVGLREGQTWTIPLLDPLASRLPGQGIPRLEAEVDKARLPWHDEVPLCFRIDYREPGKKVTARTWVRTADGLVLQQEARHQGRYVVLQREKVSK